MQVEKLPVKTFYTLKETPWYFGAYLNQARHNLFLVLNDLTIKLGTKPIPNDDQVISCKAVSILNELNPDPVLLEKAMEYYDKKLPFLFAMHYKYSNEEEKHMRKEAREKSKGIKSQKNLIGDPHKYYEIMKLLINYLHQARNHFSHYTETSFIIDSNLEYLLNDSFDVNVRIVKHRFNLSDTQIEHLRRYEDFKGPKTNKAVKKKNFKYSFKANDGSMQISEAGLAFFTAIFLPKGDAYLFLKKISGLKRSNTPEFKATVEAFCVNTIWLPKERVESDNSAQAGFLDMVNELAKCPEQLFEHLPPDKQHMFITENKERENEGLMEADEGDTNQPEQESKMVRKNNRFTFFAQRYFDIRKSFSTLRFAVDLGTYYYSIYPKEIAGNTVIRQLTKHLIGYGRLEDFDRDKRPENFLNLYKDISPLNKEQIDPYIKEIYPHYQVENNTISLYFINPETPVYWPLTKIIPTANSKSYPNKIIKDTIPKPYACISATELPAMLFYELLRNGDETQKVILNHISNIKKFFQRLSNGQISPVSDQLMQKPGVKEIKERKSREYNRRFAALIEKLKEYDLRPQYIPDRIVEILLGVAPVERKMNARQRLQRMIDEAVRLVDNMEKRERLDIKPGKKAFRKIKVGKLADLLAEDMMLMQPVLVNDGRNIVNSKANTTAFRLLQSRLAFFGQYKNAIKDIFKACRLIDSENPHPFLHKISIEDKLGIIEYYKAYFCEKAKFLKQVLSDGNYTNCYYLKVKEDRQDIRALTNAYLNLSGKRNENYTTILLPRGLFFEKTIEWLAQNGSDIMKKYVKDFAGRSNSVHLINYYFENELNDKEQEFYRSERAYKLFNEKKGKREIPKYMSHEEIETRFANIKEKVAAYKHKQEHYESVEERAKFIKAFQYYLDNEKYLRLASVQDKLIFMCIQKMLETKTGDISILSSDGTMAKPNTFQLKNVVPPNDINNKNILDCTPANGIAISLNFYEPDDKGRLQADKKAGTAIIKDRHLKIKNAGNFKKLVKDRRLNNLFFYFEKDNKGQIELSRMVLENELANYDKLRLAVLQSVADFEKKMYRTNIYKAKELFYKAEGVQEHKKYLQEFFRKHTHADIDNLQSKLNAIRNGFAHNQYPHLHDEGFVLGSAEWQRINNTFKPSAKGSTKGYGIIEKISLFAVNAYRQLTDAIKDGIND